MLELHQPKFGLIHKTCLCFGSMSFLMKAEVLHTKALAPIHDDENLLFNPSKSREF